MLITTWILVSSTGSDTRDAAMLQEQQEDCQQYRQQQYKYRHVVRAAWGPVGSSGSGTRDNKCVMGACRTGNGTRDDNSGLGHDSGTDSGIRAAAILCEQYGERSAVLIVVLTVVLEMLTL